MLKVIQEKVYATLLQQQVAPLPLSHAGIAAIVAETQHNTIAVLRQDKEVIEALNFSMGML